MSNASFYGVSLPGNCKINEYTEIFEEIYNDDGILYLLSKNTFSRGKDDEIPLYDYKYGVRVTDHYEHTGEHKLAVTLLLYPLPEYYCEDLKAKLIEEYGQPTLPDLSTLIMDDKVYIELHTEEINYQEEDIYKDKPDENHWYDYYYNVLDNEDVVNKLNIIATVLQTLNDFYGLFLDGLINMLGVTKLDELKSILCDIHWSGRFWPYKLEGGE